MPRPAKGTRLFLRPAREGHEPVWVVLDTVDGKRFERSTGCSAEDVAGAEKALADYIDGKHEPSLGETDPRRVMIADVLTYYVAIKTPGEGADARQVRAAVELTYTVERLLEFPGWTTLGDVKTSTCRAYTRHRTAQKNRRGGPNAKNVSAGTARRELATLSAAIGVYHAEYILDAVPAVALPPASRNARDRWLTRTEAASALLACLGWRFDGERWAKIPESGDSKHTANVRRQIRKKRMHVRRFLITGWLTGTRHMPIVRARWIPSTVEPYIDVDRGLFYRRGSAERQTNKRQPPVRIPPKLLVHLRRWRAADMARVDEEGKPAPVTYVVHVDGRPLKGRLRTSWEGMRRDARLGPDVVPHILRHTAATWAMQGGMPIEDASDYLGMSEKVLREHYYHFHPDFQAEAGDAFDRSRERARAARGRANESAPAHDTPTKRLEFVGQKRNTAKAKPQN